LKFSILDQSKEFLATEIKCCLSQIITQFSYLQCLTGILSIPVQIFSFRFSTK